MSQREVRSTGDQFDRWGPPALSAAAAAVVLARLWLVFHRLIDPDELEHLHAGFCVWQGMVPYRDFFEQHGPVLWYLSLPFFHVWGASLRVLVAGRFVIWLFGATSLALTWHLGNRLYGRWGGPVAALLLVLLPSFQEKNVEWRPDNVALTLVLLGVVAAERAVVKRSWRWAVLFGAALASGFLCTQKVVYVGLGLGAGFLCALLIDAWTRSDHIADAPSHMRIRRPSVLLSLLAVAGGATLVVALFVAFFAAQGALGRLIEMTIWLPLGWLTREPILALLAKLIFESPVFWGAGVAGLIMSVADLRWVADRRPAVLIALGGVAAHLAGLLLVPAAFLQYYLPFWPLVALFGTRALLALGGLLTRTDSGPAWNGLPFVVVGIAAMVAATALRWAFSPLPARWDTAFLAACVVAAITMRVARHVSVLVVLVAVALSGVPFLWIQFGPWSAVEREQRLQIERFLRATGPEDRFLDSFSGMAALRPHAFFYFWINHHSWPILPDDAKTAGLVRALSDERTRVVLADRYFLGNLPAEPTRVLYEQYTVDRRYSWADCLVCVRRGRELPPPFDWPPEVKEGL